MSRNSFRIGFIKTVTILLCLMIGMVIPIGNFTAHAASCPPPYPYTGTGCNGLNPNTMGCGTGAGTTSSVNYNGTLTEVRANNSCNAKWTRVTNQSGGSSQLAATTWYGGSNYDYSMSQPSGGDVPNGQAIYTAMLAPEMPVLGCGWRSTSTPVTKNIGTYCTYQG